MKDEINYIWNKLQSFGIILVIAFYLLGFVLSLFCPSAASTNLLAAMSIFALIIGLADGAVDYPIASIIAGFLFICLYLGARFNEIDATYAMGNCATTCGFLLPLFIIINKKKL